MYWCSFQEKMKQITRQRKETSDWMTAYQSTWFIQTGNQEAAHTCIQGNGPQHRKYSQNWETTCDSANKNTVGSRGHGGQRQAIPKNKIITTIIRTGFKLQTLRTYTSKVPSTWYTLVANWLISNICEYFFRYSKRNLKKKKKKFWTICILL